MFHAQNITAFDLPELQPYRTMRRQFDHREQGLFVAEGEKVVRRLLESRFEVVSVLLPANWLVELGPLLRARPEDVTVFVAEKKLLETLTGFSMYQGLLAVGRVPPPLSLAALLGRSPQPRLLAAVDGLSSAENLGALVRNCAAFGVQTLLVGETSVTPFLRRAVRSSMGAIFHLPVLETSSLAGTLAQLRAHGVRSIAAHPRAQARLLSETDFSGDCCLVFGSEGYGSPRACWLPARRLRPFRCPRRWTPSMWAAPQPCSSMRPIGSESSVPPRPGIVLTRDCTRSDRQDVLDAVFPQFQGNTADDNRLLFSPRLPRNLEERADQSGDGAALSRRKPPPGGSGVAMFVVRADSQGTKYFGRSRFLQVNSPLHRSTTMPRSLISSSKCSAVAGSRM